MAGIDRIIQEIKRLKNIDFSGYRRAMLTRRIEARMVKGGVNGYKEYLNRLRSDEAESERLISEIGINVSSFFRNPLVFEIISHNLLPDIIEKKGREESRELRVWSAGCAAGEEAFSLAILIHQVLKKSGRELCPLIFATDIDSVALNRAAKGVFTRESLENTRLALFSSYFKPQNNQYAVHPMIKEMVRFSYDDLTSPRTSVPTESIFGDFDLVLCRNVLIYLVEEQQGLVFSKLYRSLAAGGYLVLGESESLNDNLRARLSIVDRKNRIYQKRRS